MLFLATHSKIWRGTHFAVWLFGYSAGTGSLVKVKEHMDSTPYQQIHENNVKNLSQSWSYNKGWIFHQDSNPKHCSKPWQALMQRNKYGVLDWSKQDPRLEYQWKSLGCFDVGYSCSETININWTGYILWGWMVQNTVTQNPDAHVCQCYECLCQYLCNNPLHMSLFIYPLFLIRINILYFLCLYFIFYDTCAYILYFIISYILKLCEWE